MADHHLACLSDQFSHLFVLEPRHEDLSLVEKHALKFVQISAILHPLLPIRRLRNSLSVLLMESSCFFHRRERVNASLYESAAIVVQLILKTSASKCSVVSTYSHCFSWRG